MSIFETAVRLSPPEREAYLEAACTGDSLLAKEISERAAWQDRMGDFLLRPLIPREDPQPRFEPGTVLADRFRVERVVGEGGMAVVYEATDTRLEQRCALECPKQGFNQRLTPEVRSALRVTHENICRVHGIHTTETDWGPIDFITMEYLEGKTLAERLHEGPIGRDEAREIADQLCDGLVAAHAQGILHRDLKANNVMLTESPRGGIRAVITDFGLAGERRIAHEIDGSTSGTVGGVLSYMRRSYCAASARLKLRTSMHSG
jgi:serine/threonine protein kinase